MPKINEIVSVTPESAPLCSRQGIKRSASCELHGIGYDKGTTVCVRTEKAAPMHRGYRNAKPYFASKPYIPDDKPSAAGSGEASFPFESTESR